MAKLKGQTIAVTGGNSGIGFETCKVLAERGAHVILMGRDEHRCLRAAEQINGHVKIVVCDLADFASVRRAVERIDKLHVLINNAGMHSSQYKETVDGFEQTLQVNHLGHYLLTSLLLPKMSSNDPRVINLSSRAHENSPTPDFDDLNLKTRYRGIRAYCQSKLFNIWFTKTLDEKYPQVQTNAVHPGVIATGIFRNLPWIVRTPILKFFTKTPEEGAKTSIHLAADDIDVSGRYWRDEKPTNESKLAKDAALARRFWDWSLKATGARWPTVEGANG
ncbi:MAG: SDR family oxidoreductase [Planctomycetota bacterium]